MFPLPSTVKITPPDQFFTNFGKSWLRVIPTLLLSLYEHPRQSLPETRSSAFPYPTAPAIRCYKRHARWVENFDHWHNRQLGCRRSRGPVLDMSNRRARHVDTLTRLAAATGGTAKSADR